VNADSHSSSALLVRLLLGPVRKGVALNRHDLRFGDYVVTLTAPHTPRMPNGVECSASAVKDSRVSVGRGKIVVGHIDIAPGPGWNPVPAIGQIESLPPGPEPLTSSLATWVADPALATDALLAGYVAGLVLMHHQRKRAEAIAQRAAAKADPLSATLMRHAARGEVPEPVHDLLIAGDPGPLLAFAASGMLWLRGLVSAGFPFDAATTTLLPTARRTLASLQR
jgi:hypothetical protein